MAKLGGISGFSILRMLPELMVWITLLVCTIGGCRICSKVGQKAREARRNFGHAPFGTPPAEF